MDPTRSPESEIVLSLSLTPAEERRLLARASERGTDLTTYLRVLVEQDLSQGPKLGELMAPVHEEFRGSGMTPEELDTLIEEARDEVWREKSRATPTE